jgi:sugar transferase (PEP-CTERM/EpsH1 system associated)
VRPIRVMHVVRTLATGGTESVVRKLLSTLDPDQFQQSVCTLISTPGLRPADTVCLERSPDKAAFLVPQLARVFMRERPDIVHSRNWATIEAVAAAKIARVVAVVHSEHGRDLQTMGRQPLRRRLLRRISYAWADRVFCVSQELKQYYCRELGLLASSFEVIPNGVDVEHFRPNPQARIDVRRKLGAGPNTLVAGTVSRLDPIKDHGTLLRAAEIALQKGVDLRLVIVGDGPQRAALEHDLASKPGLAHRTLLAGDLRDVSDWLNGFDVFVLPSLSEGMSNTLLEAMAVGVATIATSVGGNLEVVEDGHSGLLVEPRDAEKICDCLIQLAAAESWRRELGRNARERVVARFSVERMLKQYEEMYCQLIKEDARWPALSRA